jgi:sodium-dependent dicarboxylate transporter 2/3/5
MTASAVSGPDKSLFMPQLAGAVCAVVILLVGLLAPTPSEITVAIQRTLAVFAATIVLWIAKPVPYVVSSILSVTLLFAFGVTDSFEEAVTGYSETLVFFLLLLLLLGHSISKVGLDERVAQRMLSATSTPQESVRSLSINLLGLSFLMPSAVARTVTFIPVVRQIRDVYQLGMKSNFERTSFFILGHINPIASMALMTGGGMAIITSELIQSSVRPITWVDWGVFMIPPTVLLYALSAVSAERIYNVDNSRTISVSQVDSDDELIEAVMNNEEPAEPLTRDEQIVGWVMLGAVLAWIVGSFTGMPTILPAIAAVTILSLPGVGIITKADIAEVSWGILFLIGAMFSILEVMQTTGALDVIVDALLNLIPFAAFNVWQSVGALLALAVVLRAFFSTASAAIVVVLPIILEFGEVLGINQLFLAFSVLLIVGSTTFLPFNTTAVLLSFDRGPLTSRDVFAFSLVTMTYSILIVTASWIVYWPLVN